PPCLGRCANAGPEQRGRSGGEYAIPTLYLRPIDGEVCLVDEAIRVGAVVREACYADRDRRPNRCSRRVDQKDCPCDGTPKSFRGLECGFGRRLGKQDGEFLAPEP